MNNEPLVIDTPEGIAHFQLARLASALSLEARTGMKHSRGSVLKHCQRVYGIKSRTKKGGAVEMERLVKVSELTSRILLTDFENCKLALQHIGVGCSVETDRHLEGDTEAVNDLRHKLIEKIKDGNIDPDEVFEPASGRL
jgi:hypothetical protein